MRRCPARCAHRRAASAVTTEKCRALGRRVRTIGGESRRHGRQGDHRATFSPPPAQAPPMPWAISETPTTAKMATTSFRRRASAQSFSRRRNAWLLAGLARWLTRMISSTVSIAMTNVIAAVICTPNETPEATMIASTKSTPSRLGPIATPITKANHTEPFSHALRTRLSSRRIIDPPSHPGAKRIAAELHGNSKGPRPIGRRHDREVHRWPTRKVIAEECASPRSGSQKTVDAYSHLAEPGVCVRLGPYRKSHWVSPPGDARSRPGWPPWPAGTTGTPPQRPFANRVVNDGYERCTRAW